MKHRTGKHHVGALVGRIRSIEPIPDADHILLAHVDIGQESELRVVFGGTASLTAGDLVPVAPPGTWIPGRRGVRDEPVKMRTERFRGQRSQGMLCSLTELGWANESTRVAKLSPGLRPGTRLPGADEWRSSVAEPSPESFPPNTVELAVANLINNRARRDPTAWSQVEGP